MGTDTSKTETGLNCDTLYTKYIWAYNSCGTSTPTTITQTTANCPCGQPITDARDGKSYNTVLIGEQCWMVQNLNTGATNTSGFTALPGGYRDLSGGFYNLTNEDYFWSSSESSSSNAWRRYLCYNYENVYRYGNYKTHGARGAA